MKRDFLEAMGITKEQVDSILDVNSTDIGNAKKELESVQSELDTVKEQLQEANTTIEGFADYEEVKGQVAEYKEKFKNAQKEYQTQLADRDFSDMMREAISAAGGRSVKAVMAELDIDALKASKNQKEDIAAALNECRETNDWMFGSTEPINNPVGPTGAPIIGMTKEQFDKMGYKERFELKQKDPAKYEEMKG